MRFHPSNAVLTPIHLVCALRLRIVALGLLVLGCAQSSAPTLPADNELPLPASFVGSWDWESSSGGLKGDVYTPASTGQTSVLRIDANGQLEWTTNGASRFAGRARLTREETALRAEPVLVLVLVSPPGPGWMIEQATQDRLVLYDLCIDCFMHVFTRRSP